MAEKMTPKERRDLRAYLRGLEWEHSASCAEGYCAPRCDCSIATEIEWARACLQGGVLYAANEV